MTRLTISLLALLCLLSPALATLSPREDRLGFRKDRYFKPIKNSAKEFLMDSPSGLVKESSDQEQKAEFRMTEQTEIELDGRRCKYEEVPNDAVIILLEVESDENKAVLKIHFRSKK
jgi:hypothetical protein